MKRFFILGCLFFGISLGFGACQCSDKPDVGPVEGAATLELHETPRPLT